MRDKYYFFKGRVALYAILKAMGIKPGDEVILPGFTCVVVPNAVMYLGANPIYVDIAPTTYNIDPNKIEERITGRTRAIIAQHTFGIPADMVRILDIARKYNLYIIEDSCHAVGSKYKGGEVGTLGDASFYSSQWSKPVTTGLGGWAVINKVELQTKMKKVISEFGYPSLRENILLRLQYWVYHELFSPSMFWFARDIYRMFSHLGIAVGSSSDGELAGRMPAGYEKRMSTWQRDLLEKRLAEVSQINDHRRWVVSLYEKLFMDKGIRPLGLTGDYEPVYLRYPVLVENKEGILQKARGKKVELGEWFLSPVHPNIEGWEKAGYKKGCCPNAEMVCKHIINLPTYQGIGMEEVEMTIELLGSETVL